MVERYGYEVPNLRTPEELTGEELSKWKDEIVEEVRQARESYAAQFDYDLKRMFEDLKKKEIRIRDRAQITIPPPRLVLHASICLRYPHMEYVTYRC